MNEEGRSVEGRRRQISQGASRTALMTEAQKVLIDQRAAKAAPSKVVAYLLCLVFGMWGGHRFYLGEKASGFIMLVLGVSIVGLLITGPWALIDLFRIPNLLSADGERIRQRVTIETWLDARSPKSN